VHASLDHIRVLSDEKVLSSALSWVEADDVDSQLFNFQRLPETPSETIRPETESRIGPCEMAHLSRQRRANCHCPDNFDTAATGHVQIGLKSS
jgi:hypothetical protein